MKYLSPRTGRIGKPMVLGTLLFAISALGQNSARPVETAEAEWAPLPISVELVGTVNSRNQSSLSTQVEGLVEHLEVDVGGQVEVGDVLLKLDATVTELRRERTIEEIKGAHAELAEARRRLEEIRALVENGGVSETELKSRQTQVQIREAVVARLELILREEEEILKRHTLRAPFAGLISERHAQVGEWVSPGVPVFQLVEAGFRTFDIRAPQNLFTKVSRSTRAEVRLDIAPDETFPATIAVIVPSKDPNTRTFLIRLEVAAPDRLLLAGASGRAKVYMGSDEPRISIPVDALVRQPDGSFVVWGLSNEGSEPKAELRRIELGERAGNRVEILTGLQAGERIIVRGNENLLHGQTVRVIFNAGSGS